MICKVTTRHNSHWLILEVSLSAILDFLVHLTVTPFMLTFRYQHTTHTVTCQQLVTFFLIDHVSLANSHI